MQLIRKPFGNSEQWILDNRREYVAILPSFGGAINQYRHHAQAGKPAVSFIWGYETEAEALEKHLTEYRGAKLSPSPNRTCEGAYSFEGKNYQMPLNFFHEDHQIHGCLADKSFEVLESSTTDQEVSLKLGYDYKGDYPGYPFLYHIEVTYQLHINEGFSCHTKVVNQGSQSLPIGDGWHPYFGINGLSVNELELQVPKGSELLVNELMVPTGEKSPFKLFQERQVLGNYRFDGCLVLKGEGKAYTQLYAPSLKAGINIWQEVDRGGAYRYLQLYTPDNRQTIAIEPMSCAIDALNNKEGLLVLKPQEEASFSWGIQRLLL